MMNQQQKRVLIIGAGPSGLSMLRAFNQQTKNFNKTPQIVCCQKQADWGGQWNYITKEKTDKHGIPIPSTNQYLWTNAPKECFEYPDYSFDQHFNGCPMPSYLPRQYLRDYFTKRFQKYDIKKYIKFETIAKNIHYDLSHKKFYSQIEDLNTKSTTIQYFDYVVIAAGHYSAPNIPQFQGLQNFEGKLLHSIDVKDYREFGGERILIIGTGLSSQDAVLQSYKYGAKSISITYRTKPMSQKFPKQIEQFPLIEQIQGKTVTFKNGEKRSFDTIIMCTGYVHNFTFLDKELRLQTTNRLWSEDLYMGIVWQKNPQLMYIGMQAQYFSFMMFDIQSFLAKDIILGNIEVPSLQKMKKDNQIRFKLEKNIKNSYDSVYYIGSYLRDMIRMCEYPGYELEKVIELYIQLQKHKQQDIITFRQNIYQSTVTGKWSIRKKQSWLQAGNRFQNGNSQDPQAMEDELKIIQKLSLLADQVDRFQISNQLSV